jgi:hypothetical protein
VLYLHVLRTDFGRDSAPVCFGFTL